MKIKIPGSPLGPGNLYCCQVLSLVAYWNFFEGGPGVGAFNCYKASIDLCVSSVNEVPTVLKH